MREIDVLNNLRQYDCWEYSNYSLCEAEARVIIKVLKERLGIVEDDENEDS